MRLIMPWLHIAKKTITLKAVAISITPIIISSSIRITSRFWVYFHLLFNFFIKKLQIKAEIFNYLKFLDVRFNFTVYFRLEFLLKCKMGCISHIGPFKLKNKHENFILSLKIEKQTFANSLFRDKEIFPYLRL